MGLIKNSLFKIELRKLEKLLILFRTVILKNESEEVLETDFNAGILSLQPDKNLAVSSASHQ